MKSAAEINNMIAEFVEYGPSSQMPYQIVLAKFATLERHSLRLNEMENDGIPDPDTDSVGYEVYFTELDSIEKDVKKIIEE